VPQRVVLKDTESYCPVAAVVSLLYFAISLVCFLLDVLEEPAAEVPQRVVLENTESSRIGSVVS
jgi:hypothetical protein